MAFNGTNPVSVGDPTRKSDYDRVFDNTVAIQDGSESVDAMDIVTGIATSSGFHIGEAADEGGWLTSTVDTQLIVSGGAEYVSGSWIARATEAALISLSIAVAHFYHDTSLTDGSSFTPTVRMAMSNSALDMKELFIQGTEIADPVAPAANKVRIYFRDTGGKTELVARFPTGAIQQIAIEP